MKKLLPIPDHILKKHSKSYLEPIKSVLTHIIDGNCQGFPTSISDLLSEQAPMNAADVSCLKVFLDLFDSYNLLTATAESIRNFVVKEFPIIPFTKTVSKLLSEVFDYSMFCDGKHLSYQDGKFCLVHNDDNWGRYEYLRHFSNTLKYCPYCNADTVYAFEKADSRKAPNVASALDHFYPKGKYPFLALSLYNLIPVCFRCNTQMKGGGDMQGVANPFIEDMHHNVFFYPVLSEVSPPLDAPYRMAILPKEGCRPEAVAFVRRFELESLYSSAFSHEALLCMEKARRYTPAFRRHMASMIGQNDPRLVEMLWFGMPLDESEINKNHLGKMKLDIVEQFRV